MITAEEDSIFNRAKLAIGKWVRQWVWLVLCIYFFKQS